MTKGLQDKMVTIFGFDLLNITRQRTLAFHYFIIDNIQKPSPEKKSSVERHLSIVKHEMINFPSSVLEVSSLNLIAQKFYKKLDFIYDGLRKDYYSKNEDALLYTLRLK